MRYKNLVLLGTSHIAQQSLREVEQTIKETNPAVIALELDTARLHALLSKKKRRIRLRDIRKIGFKGFLFSVIGAWAEKKLGERTGVKPGAEMIKAYKLAKERKIPIALIDQEIEYTLHRFSETLTWKEKWNFLVDILKALVLRKKELPFDLRTVPDAKVIKKLTKQMKQRYPNVYKVLVEERNSIMAGRLAQLMLHQEDTVLGIIGAGHEKEIVELIKKKLQQKVPPMFSYEFSVDF